MVLASVALLWLKVRRGSVIMPEKKKKVKVVEDLALGGEKKKKSMAHGTTQGRSQGNI